MKLDFSAENTKAAGGKFADMDWTFSNSTWLEETAKSGWTGVYFRSSLVGVDSKTEDKNWMLMGADELRDTYGIVVGDDGTLEVIDEDKAKQFQPKTSQDTAQLFNSMQAAGVPRKILENIGGNPGGVDGYTFHLVEKPTGKKQTKKVNGVKVETQYDQTRLVVDADGLVSAPGGKKAGASAAASKPAKGKPAPVEEPEEEEEESADNDDPVEAAAVATIQTVLPNPKKFVGTFNAKQHGGGVTMAQMGAAALGNAIPKEHKGAPKAEVSKLLRKPDIYEKFNGELWNFDSEDGVVSSID
jgi:hypothetical protein